MEEQGQEKLFSTLKMMPNLQSMQEEGRAGGRSWNGAWQIKN
jgi:hypothetical protein